MQKSVSGFTIVELLIVIVIIAILAAISVTAYTGIQNRANDSAIQSDLKTLATKLQLYKIQQDTYPANGTLPDLAFKATKTAYETSGTTSNLVYCYTTDRLSFVVTALSKSKNIYYISSQDPNPQKYTGVWSLIGPCSAAVPGTEANNFRGYAAEDTTSGPWRAWAGN